MNTRHLVDREIAPIIDLFPRVDLDAAPIAQIRARAAETYAILPPPVIAPEKLVVPSIHGGPDIMVFLYRPATTHPDGGAILHIHGGGMVMGSVEQMQAGPAALAAAAGVPVVSVEYRLAPEHPFPAAPIDCEAATRWVADNIPCTGLVLSGESAGGNLTIATALTLRDNPASKPVIAIHPIYPAVTTHDDWQSYRDFGEGHLLTTGSMTYFGNHYAPDPADYRASPLDFPAAGLPPTLLTTAGLDPLRDQGRAYAAKLIEAGVPTTYREATGSIHGYINLAQGIPSAKEDIRGALMVLKAIVAEASGAA